MHKKRLVKFFRNAISAALMVSMLAGNISSEVGIAYAKESVQVQNTEEYVDADESTAAVNKAQIVLPSGWSEPVYCYAYDSATGTVNNGKFPGEEMTKVEGTDNVYEYTVPENIENPRVIFYSSDINRTPADSEPGYLFEENNATYRLEEGVWEKVAVEPTITPEPTATVTPEPTVTPEVTNKPTPTIKPGTPTISSSLPDGSVFTTETETITLTVANYSLETKYHYSVEGTYSVDGGPEKKFTGTTEVEIGKGKIGDSEITVEVSAPGVSKTYTYIKKYTAETSEEKEVFENSVDASAETRGLYETNPNKGFGKQATITIDGDASDWSSDMLIAQGAAWDVANTWKGAHEDSLTDCYALYAAWDDENLYLGMEMVNTTDTWQTEGNASLMNNGKIGDVPIMFALNVGNRTAISGKMEADSADSHPWGVKTEFETRVDNLLIMSAVVGSGTPGFFIAKEDGTLSYDKDHCLSFKDNGIEYAMADTSISPTLMQLSGSKDVSDAYDASKYQDALTAEKAHNRKYDSFFEINIPLKALGIDKSYLENNSVGVMGFGTRNESAIDCIPHDPSMLDNVMEEYRAGDNTSYEKEDLDIITVPLATVGTVCSVTDIPTPTAAPTDMPEVTITQAPEVTVTEAPTPEPTKTPVEKMNVNFGADRSAPQYNTTELTVKAIAKEGTAPYSYEFFVDDESVQNGESDTYKWQNDSVGAHTIKVVVTDSTGEEVISEKEYDLESEDGEEIPTITVTEIPTVVPTEEPTVTPTAVPTVTEAPTVTPTKEPTDDFLTVYGLRASTMNAKVGDKVKFAADSYASADCYPVYYKFTCINQETGVEILMRAYAEDKTASYTFTEPGTYTIKVYAIDSSGSGKVVSEELEGFVAEDDKILTPTATPTEAPTATPTEAPTATPTEAPTATPTEAPTATPTEVPTEAPTAAPTEEPTVMPTEEPTKVPTSVPTVAPTKEPAPTVAPLKVQKFTASKKSGKAYVGNTVKLTAGAEGGKGTLSYQFSYELNGKTKVIKAYSKSNTANFKPKEIGKYKLILQVKDASGTVVTKTIGSYSIKSKLAVKKLKVSYSDDKLKFKTTVKDSKGTVKYKYVVKLNGKTKYVRNYSTSKSASFKTVEKGKYKVIVYVKDSSKKEVKKTISYKVK